MKYNLNTIKKTEQVIFRAMQEITKDNVGITILTNSITNAKVYFLIHEAKPYIDIEFLSGKLQLTKEQIFSLVDEDSFLVDSFTYRTGIHYYLPIEDTLLLVQQSPVKDKDKHVNGLQYVFNKALDKYAKSIEFKMTCQKLKIR